MAERRRLTYLDLPLPDSVCVVPVVPVVPDNSN